MGMSLHAACVSGGARSTGIVASHGHAWAWDPLGPLCHGALSLSLPSWRLEGCSVSEVMLQAL